MQQMTRLIVACAAIVLLGGACMTEETMLAPIPGDPDFQRDPALDVENISAHNESRSHNVGMNCMQCHQAFGPGLGQFQVAGSVFDTSGSPVANPVLELRTAPDGAGNVIIRIEGDLLGNIYTTGFVELIESRLFPHVTNEDGTVVSDMPFPVMNGACNHCHTGGFKVRIFEDTMAE